jgi:hypothetical protein
MTYLVKYGFGILAEVKGAVALFLMEILIFQKIKKAFLQTFMTSSVLTKSSGPKHLEVAFTPPIFASFILCHTDISGGGGGQ